MPSAETRRAYSRLATPYIATLGTLDTVHPADLALITESFASVGGPILDAGCGPGHLLRHLHDLGHVVTGADLVAAFLEHARSASPTVGLARADLFGLPYADASFGGVLAWYSLIHLDPAELDLALAELRRVLRPGGVLVAGFFDGEDASTFDHKVTTAYRWSEHGLTPRLCQARLKPLRWEHRPKTVDARAHLGVVALATT